MPPASKSFSDDAFSDDALPTTTSSSKPFTERPENPGISDFINTADVSNALYEVELASYIDTDVPTYSRWPLARPIKLVVRKLGGFYARFVSSQLVILARELVSAMRLLAEATNSKVSVVPTIQPAELPAPVIQSAIKHLTSADGRVADGRVIVLDCATPELLNALEEAGIDAYGIAADISFGRSSNQPGNASPVDTSPVNASPVDANASAEELPCDLRHTSASGHLALIPAGTLGGALLIGFVDQATVGRKLELLASVVSACKPGAPVTVVTATLQGWESQLDDAARDLAEGKPLRPATWHALLTEHGLVEITEAAGTAADDFTIITGRLG